MRLGVGECQWRLALFCSATTALRAAHPQSHSTRWLLCRLDALQSALTDVLASCSPSLHCLHLEVAGAPLLVCRVREQLAAGGQGMHCTAAWFAPLPLLHPHS
jgi:hypothetical protein